MISTELEGSKGFFFAAVDSKACCIPVNEAWNKEEEGEVGHTVSLVPFNRGPLPPAEKPIHADTHARPQDLFARVYRASGYF